MWACQERNNADGRVPMVLRVRKLPHGLAPKTGPLLCVLLVRFGAVPSNPGRWRRSLLRLQNVGVTPPLRLPAVDQGGVPGRLHTNFRSAPSSRRPPGRSVSAATLNAWNLGVAEIAKSAPRHQECPTRCITETVAFSPSSDFCLPGYFRSSRGTFPWLPAWSAR